MKKRVMTVDDSSTVRQMVKFVLEAEGMEVLQAVDGVEALKQLGSQEVNLVLVDLNMPNMDGFELTRRLRAMATYRFVPIVLLTTESQEHKKQEGKAAGATAWIVKPFDPVKLVAVVKKVMR